MLLTHKLGVTPIYLLCGPVGYPCFKGNDWSAAHAIFQNYSADFFTDNDAKIPYLVYTKNEKVSFAVLSLECIMQFSLPHFLIPIEHLFAKFLSCLKYNEKCEALLFI